MFSETINEMEKALAQLPDPPVWSLRDEIMKPPQTSRMSDAEFSLPICAAVQVGLVQLLRRAGITFHTVVGHSGGEIGAAYAVGTINEIDAVKIAYYRGIVCKLAVGADGRRGLMIAVGFGYQEGLAFCATAQMKGRLTVAASNSPKSVTLAGDKDAVMEAKQILDKESMFNRVLQVDTGYHSHHMLPCAEPYTEQLKHCNVAVGSGNGFTAWVSSVYPDNRTIGPAEDADMAGQYWTDNLIGRVLFSQALERALEDERGPPDMILEVGPHPALRGPSLETVRTKLGFEVPYSGVLDRKLDDVTALSNAIGSVWTYLGSACVNFHGYASAFSQTVSIAPLPDLPTYAWDHKQILWRESRLNKQVRSRQDRPHELLGSRTPDDTEYEPRWRNFLKLEEMPWLRNHRIQNQIIVPAAAYCVMALEAAKVLGRGKSVQSIELLNVAIMRPIVLDEASEGTETLLSLRSNLDSKKEQGGTIHANFSLSSGAMEMGHLKTAATGEILIHLGNNDSEQDDVYPENKSTREAGLIPVNVDQFYASLDKIGLNYSGPFKTLLSVERRMNVASAEVAVDEEVGTSISVHPTWLDVCFQTFLAAFAAPRDDSLWTAFMPTAIGSMKFLNPNPGVTPTIPASVNTHLDEMIPGYMATLPTLKGDMNIYNSHTGQLVVCVEDFTMSSFLPATEKNDKLLYMKMEWQQDVLSGIAFDPKDTWTSPDEIKLIDACEKTIQYYLQQFDEHDASRDKTQANPYLGSLVTKARARQVSMPSDSEMSLILEKFGAHIDMKLIRMIGESLSPQPQLDQKPNTQLPAPLSELIMQWHNEGLGFAKLEKHFACALKQIAHKHERLRVLQVGPSSVNLVKAMCQELEHTLGPYIVVDSSTQMLNEMKHRLVNHSRVAFHAFDVEREGEYSDDVIAAGSFDVIIVHKAFRNQAATLRTIRGLMRPGGFLIMMAATGQQLRFPFFLASSPPDADLLHQEDSDRISHIVHRELQDAGFSGIDSIGLDSTPQKHTFSVVVSQALDDQVRFMRAPLSAAPTISMSGKLLILGGSSTGTEALLERLQDSLSRVWKGAITVVKSLVAVGPTELNGVDAVLSITELDGAMLKNLSEDTFTSLQRLLSASKTVLWVTQGARAKDPYQSSTIGLFRTFQSENLRKHVQLLDVDTLDESGSLIADAFLRLMGGAALATENPELSPLWTLEEELVVKDGKFFIPRLFLDQDRNRRINSLRRRVESPVAETLSNVTLHRPQGNNSDVYVTEDVSIDQSKLGRADGQVTLKVKYCSLDAVIPNFDDKQVYCCFGRTESGLPMIALSTSQSSSVTVPYDWAIPYAHSGLQSDDALELLTRILSEIKSNVIVNSMPTGFTTLLSNADPYLADSLVKRSDLSNKDFAFLNAQKSSGLGAVHDRCIYIDSQASTKSLKLQIPQKAKLLIDIGRKYDTQELSTFHQNLPASISFVNYCDLESPFNLVPSDLLSAAFRTAKSTDASSKRPFDSASIVTVSELVQNGIKNQPHASIVDWTKDPAKTLINIPIQTHSLFSKDKTYILVGLTGHIGQSVCRWMVDNGARHIVLTSRYVAIPSTCLVSA
jgi:acyl transferase domain-containing protein